MPDNITQFESVGGFSGANLFVSGGATFSGTLTATTAAVGTNTTQVATTAFVQNEIIADTVTAFNGRTGSVQGVSAAVAGTGISVSGATGAVTITNIGVQSFNGLTGAVGGVTTSAANTFTALQTFNSGISADGGITFGVTAAFRSSISLQNSEFIRNTTDGRMDFMPAPSSSTAFGVYLDFTSWTFGPSIGTIRSSDGALNASAIRYDTSLLLNNDVDFAFGSNSAYKLRTTVTNVNFRTLQLGLPAGTVGYSSALALMDYAYMGTSTRQPNTVHSHPNLYIYSAGNANANDFIRLEHDRTNANIVTGQTSGIRMQPGSGFVGISGGISAAGFTFGAPGARLVFPGLTGAFNGGYLWLQDGFFQIGGSVPVSGGGSFFYNPSSERFYVFGAADFNQSYNYEAARSPLRLNVGPNHTAPILATYVQTAEGTQLGGSHNSTNMVAGIDNKGVLFSYAGLSTSGGATLTGTIALNGQTFTNVVSSVNGLTGAIGVLIGPIAVTSGNYTVFTYPDGVTTTGSKRPYYQSPYYGGRATSTAAMVANRTYFLLHNTPRGVSLTTLRLSTASTGVTGNVHFSVWSVNTSNGVPNQRLYVSNSIAIPSSFNFATVTNSNGLVRVPSGSFYIAASFSSTPTIYTHTQDRSPHMFGSQDYTSGYNFYLPAMDTNGFTAPSSITQSGTTFGFIDYYPTQLTIPILEWQGA